MLTQGELLGANLFAYCNNNPVMFMDPTGYGPVGVVIGAILGFGLGAILSPYIADLIGLKGWKRTVFIWGGTAVITALGAWAGYYIGEAIFKIYKAGGAFASKINEAIIKGITKLVGGSVKAASGNGWTLNVGKLVVRLMNTGGGRTCYIHLSVAGKMAYDIFGNVVNDAAKTHIPITIENIVRLVALIFKLK